MPFPFYPSPTIFWTLTNGEKLASCEVAFVPNGGASEGDAEPEAALLPNLLQWR